MESFIEKCFRSIKYQRLVSLVLIILVVSFSYKYINISYNFENIKIPYSYKEAEFHVYNPSLITRERDFNFTCSPLNEIATDKQREQKINTCVGYSLYNNHFEKLLSSKKYELTPFEDHGIREVKIHQDSAANLLNDREELVKCIKYFFHKRFRYFFQKKHEPLALKLQLQLISRHLCLTRWDHLDLNYFQNLTLTRRSEEPEVFDIKSYTNSEYCVKKKQILLFQNHKEGTGFGSRINIILQALKLSFVFRETSRILVALEGNSIFTPLECKYSGYRCFWQPITSCHVTSADFKTFGVSLKNVNQWDDWHSKPRRRDIVRTKGNVIDMIPEEFAERSRIWLRSQLLYFLLQPTDTVYKHFKTKTKSIEKYLNTSNVAIMHIRHGDKYVENQLFSFESYVVGLRFLEKINRIRIKDILLLTDDHDMIKNKLIKYEKYISRKNYSFHSFGTPKKSLKSNTYEALASGQISRENFGYDLLSSIYATSEGKYFIGTFTSNFGRTIFKWNYALQGKMIDHVSLSHWNMDYALQKTKIYSFNMFQFNDDKFGF